MLVAICIWLGLLLVPLPGFWLVPRPYRSRVATILLGLIPIHVGVLVVANQLYQFIPSETDTYLYYSLSIGEGGSALDILLGHTFSEGVFDGHYITKDWGGMYLKLLTISNFAFGDSLVLRKGISLPFLWLAVIAVYSIALPAFGRRAASWMAIATGLLPTLWYPFTVLYRDAITMSLHVVSLAGFLFAVLSPTNKGRALLITALAIGLLYAFRPGTLLINAIIFLPLGVFVLLLLRGAIRRFAVVGTGIIILSMMIHGISRYQIAAGFQEARIGGSSGLHYLDEGLQGLPRRWISSLHLFIVSEPTLFSRRFDISDSEYYRGMMNGIWVLVGAPFMLVGTWFSSRKVCAWITQRQGLLDHPYKVQHRAISMTTVAHAEIASVVICAAMLWYIISWSLILSGLADFTRWRLPAVPIMIIMAVHGWRQASTDLRWAVMFVWLAALIMWRVLVSG